GDHRDLVKDIDEYVQHVSLHLSKENQRLFVMADMILKGHESLVNESLAKVEYEKLQKLG
ncbi:MAG: cation-binding protein, partial [Thermoproteota archaeon]|nr:cation-binding protein [Thermoproteota archaeon]